MNLPVKFVWWCPWKGIPHPLPESALAQLAKILNAGPLHEIVTLETGRHGEALLFQRMDDCWAVAAYKEPGDDLGQGGHQGIVWSGSCMDEVPVESIRQAAATIIIRHFSPSLFPEFS